MDDKQLDILLGEALALPDGPADRGFVLRVERVAPPDGTPVLRE